MLTYPNNLMPTHTHTHTHTVLRHPRSKAVATQVVEGILETTEDAILQDDHSEEGSEVKGSEVMGTEVTEDLDHPTEVVDGSTKLWNNSLHRLQVCVIQFIDKCVS